MPRGTSATKVSKSKVRSASKPKVAKAKPSTTPQKVAKPQVVKVKTSEAKVPKVTKKNSSASKGRSHSKKTKSSTLFSNMATAPEPKETPVKKETKSKSKSKAKTPTKSSAKKEVSKPRNYFTVSEDWTILEFSKRNSEVKNTVVAKTMAQKLGRSSESIRDRVKKYLSKISEKDHSKIQAAAKKTPGFHVHYGTDKAGGNRKTVTDICANEPGLKNSASKNTSDKKSTLVKRVIFIDLPQAPSPSKAKRSASQGPTKKSTCSSNEMIDLDSLINEASSHIPKFLRGTPATTTVNRKSVKKCNN